VSFTRLADSGKFKQVSILVAFGYKKPNVANTGLPNYKSRFLYQDGPNRKAGNWHLTEARAWRGGEVKLTNLYLIP
jgi:hypothetical protein